MNREKNRQYMIIYRRKNRKRMNELEALRRERNIQSKAGGLVALGLGRYAERYLEIRKENKQKIAHYVRHDLSKKQSGR